MKKVLPCFLIIILVLFDQTVKWWVLKHPLFLIKNPGFIFGYGPNLDLFFWITIFLILILSWFTVKKPQNTYPFALMIAGAIGNLTDRILRGYVVDYFQINIFFSIAFNISDILLIVGAFIYVWQVGKANKN